MEILIDLDVLERNKLSISEYVYLKALYEKKSKDELSRIVSHLDLIEEDQLQEKGYLKILSNGEVILRTSAEKLFDSGDLFTRFLVMFPVKTPDGRYLSPRGEETVMGRKLRAKWNRHFDKKPHKEKKALEVLEAELKWRRQNNKMMYMHNAEAWLNQGDYEKFEYLLEEQQEEQQNRHKDFM